MEYLDNLVIAIFNTLFIYMIAWFIGSILGILLSYFIWRLPNSLSRKFYIFLTGFSFLPVTILIPYAIRIFGLNLFIYPLLSLPVFLTTFASSYEAFQHANKHRLTLLINYNVKKIDFFWKVVFRESLPSMKTTMRQTLSLSFAIFIALDYFIENWSGLGSLLQRYYAKTSFGFINHLYMFSTILVAALLGVSQIVLNDFMFKKLTEFRRHY